MGAGSSIERARCAPLRISAVGDIAFEGPEADSPSYECFAAVADQLRQADLAIGNLECALVRTARPGISDKCMLRSSPAWAGVLREAGFGLVTLANNHIMDFGAEGLMTTMEALREAGVRPVGAGRNWDEARAPVYIELAHRRVAFLGRSAVIVSAPVYAAEDVPGVAFLEPGETADAIRTCRSRADVVVLMVHWGIEEYSYPSPAQRALARQFVDAGADLILGHHPHVLQGVETLRTGMVAYSLGNFTFDEFDWTYALPDGTPCPQFAGLSPNARRGVIAMFEWPHGTPSTRPSVSTVFTRIGSRGRIAVDADPARERHWRALCAGLERRFYGIRWRWHALRREWALRLGEQASPTKLLANLHRIRVRHIARAYSALLRSLRIVAEKTTNPYE
jgi:poly-gamma-glutamate capsule biosynthesis protein CapA/YwtB (metallophosphatase superfamily)